MLIEVRDEIIDLLAGLAAAVEPYMGQAEDALAAPRPLPALWVLFAGKAFQPPELIGAQPPVRHDCYWTVLVAASTTAGNSRGQESVLGLVEKVENALCGVRVSRGMLWPAGLELLLSANGKAVYALSLVLEDVQDIERDFD